MAPFQGFHFVAISTATVFVFLKPLLFQFLIQSFLVYHACFLGVRSLVITISKSWQLNISHNNDDPVKFLNSFLILTSSTPSSTSSSLKTRRVSSYSTCCRPVSKETEIFVILIHLRCRSPATPQVTTSWYRRLNSLLLLITTMSNNLFYDSLLFFTAEIFDWQIWQKLLMERSTL